MNRLKCVFAGVIALVLVITMASTFLPTKSEAQANVTSANLARFVAFTVID